MKKIALIPIDNRPVCYSLIEQIAACDKDLKLFLPPRKMLGDLTKPADVNAILNWFEELESVDIVIISLDTIAYGGLISSRKNDEKFDEIKARLDKFKKLLIAKNSINYAFSSIMRISNNNINEEEKPYWNKFGKEIFNYSYNLHKCEKDKHDENSYKLNSIPTTIPYDILDDYLNTRKRNFEINRLYLEWANEFIFDTLVFSKDDCAQFGLNVKEAELLQSEILDKKLNVLIKTGADEIPLSLLSRALLRGKYVKIAPIFTRKNSINKISKYEDICVFDCVKGQIELAGAQFWDETEADIILLVNNFENEQGEWVMGIYEQGFDGDFELPDKPYIIADILNANGADNLFVEKLFNINESFDKNFLGYAGWNTSANTIGSAICAGLVKFLAGNFDKVNFEKLQLIRFLDDLAYQANIRQLLKANYSTPNPEVLQILNFKMQKYSDKLNAQFKTDYKNINYIFPWNRFFEIEVLIQK